MFLHALGRGLTAFVDFHTLDNTSLHLGLASDSRSSELPLERLFDIETDLTVEDCQIRHPEACFLNPFIRLSSEISQFSNGRLPFKIDS